MKKNNFKKIFVVFSLCVFLLSLFSLSSFAANTSDAVGAYLYKFESSLAISTWTGPVNLNVNGYLVNKSNGSKTSFSSLTVNVAGAAGSQYYTLSTGDDTVVLGSSSAVYDVYIDYSENTLTKSDVESVFSTYFNYSVTSLSVPSMFKKVNNALVGGTNSEGVAYDGLLGMVSKFGKFLVSSPLLLVLCIALPLVSFSVGLIIRIKNRV